VVAFLGGVVGIAALWTQRDLNRQQERERERDAAAKKATEDHPA